MTAAGWFHRPPRRPWWLAKYGAALFAALLIGGIGVLFVYDTPMNAGYHEAFAWLWAPWLLVVAVFTARYWAWLRSGRPGWRGPLLAVVMWPMLMLASAPYVLLINSFADHGWAVYRGSVIDKHITGGRSRASVVTVRDTGGRGELSVALAPADYERVRIGQIMQCRYRIGVLRIPFRWRRADSGPVCARVDS
jgi:hypothetical protein